jgi:hypothetical protein
LVKIVYVFYADLEKCQGAAASGVIGKILLIYIPVPALEIFKIN